MWPEWVSAPLDFAACDHGDCQLKISAVCPDKGRMPVEVTLGSRAVSWVSKGGEPRLLHQPGAARGQNLPGRAVEKEPSVGLEISISAY